MSSNFLSGILLGMSSSIQFLAVYLVHVLRSSWHIFSPSKIAYLRLNIPSGLLSGFCSRILYSILSSGILIL